MDDDDVGAMKVGLGVRQPFAPAAMAVLPIATAPLAAPGADEQRPVVGKIVRAERDVIGDELENLRQHRHHARLVALAGDSDRVARAGNVPGPQAERFGNAQSRAVEQGEHGGIAGEDPRLAIFA